jgi:hypothetical protein
VGLNTNKTISITLIIKSGLLKHSLRMGRVFILPADEWKSSRMQQKAIHLRTEGKLFRKSCSWEASLCSSSNFDSHILIMRRPFLILYKCRPLRRNQEGRPREARFRDPEEGNPHPLAHHQCWYLWPERRT